MRISLESLDGRHFVLELPLDAAPDKKHVISIQNATNLRGIYQHDDAAFALEGAKIDELVAEVLWHLASGPLKIAGPLTAGAIALDLVIPRGENSGPTAGRAECASLTVPALTLTVGDAKSPTRIAGRVAARAFSAANPAEPNAWHILSTELECTNVAVQRTGLDVGVERLIGDRVAADIGGGTTVARFTSAAISGVSVEMPAFGVRVTSVRLKDLRLVSAPSGLTIEIAEAELSGVSARIGHGALAQHVKTAGSIRLRGFRFAEGDITCARLEVDDAELAVTLAAPQSEAVAPESSAAQPSRPFKMPDLTALDGLNGFVNADVRVDVRLPVISHRVFSHKTRLDVRDGTVDFKKLENGLSMLEDALIDFEVRKNVLVIEVKGVKKTLVSWPLDAEGVALAVKDRVKIRTLASPDIPKSEPAEVAPPPERDKDKESSVGLRRIDVDGIEVQLGLSGGATLTLPQGTIRLGSRGVPALEQLTLQGALTYAPADAARSARTEQKSLRASVRGLNLGIDALAFGSSIVKVGTISLAELRETTLTMAGVVPVKIAASARGLVLESVAYRNSAPARA